MLVVALLATGVSARRHHYWMEEEPVEGRQLSVAAGEMQWFEVKLNQFDPANMNTMNLRYLVNDTYWGGVGSPVFVMLGGEGPLSPRELSGRFVINEYAERYHALMVAIEHRFYGESMPAGGLTVENLHYLTSLQANADFAAFIDYVLRFFKTPDSKVVTFGGSYSGSLSAWMRQKYPSLVHAAIASSAPVLAQVDFPGYLNVIQDSLGPSCTARVRDAYAAIGKLLQTPAGRAELTKAYSACEPISEQRYDQATFLESVSNPICDTVQYNRDNIGRTIDITTICGILEDASVDAETAMRNLHKFWDTAQNITCMDSTYVSQLRELGNIDPHSPYAAGRAWTYQTCAEFGYYQSAEGPDTAFDKMIDLPYFLSMCKDIYGIESLAVFDNIDRTNYFYGGRKIASTRIVLPNGSIDPWHALGVVNTTDPNLYPLYIVGTAHCADLYQSSTQDLPGLTNARNQIIAHLDEWLA